MIKVKMGELLNIASILSKIGRYDTEDINLQFKLKIALLNKKFRRICKTIHFGIAKFNKQI